MLHIKLSISTEIDYTVSCIHNHRRIGKGICHFGSWKDI